MVDKTKELSKREEEALIYFDVGKPPRAPPPKGYPGQTDYLR